MSTPNGITVENTVKNETGKDMAQSAESNMITMDNPIDSLISMAINKDIDMDKLERLLAMKEREEAKTAFSAFVVAISNFQAECPRIPKTGTVTDKSGNKIYNYPKLDKILEVIQPFLDKNNLCVRTSSEFVDNTVRATCKVSHTGGHTDETTFVIPIEASMAGGANAGQRTASANSFARRYAMMNALNLVGSDEDDDGQSIELEFIDEKDAIILRDLISELKGTKEENELALCQFLKKGLTTLDELPINLLGKARKAIRAQKLEDRNTP